MKGKSVFTKEIAQTICVMLDKVRLATPSEQKVIRARIRDKTRFYISDFRQSPQGFTRKDFDDLVQCGRIRIIE